MNSINPLWEQLIAASNFDSFDILKQFIENRRLMAQSILKNELKDSEYAVSIFNQNNIELLQILGISKVSFDYLKEADNFKLSNSIIQGQRTINESVMDGDIGVLELKYKDMNDVLAELINNNPDLPLEIAKRLEYKPDDTKNVDIEFDKRKFYEKVAYNSFVNGIIIQLQTGHIDFAKAILEIQNYKTY